MIKVSVIIPIYNVEKYIERCTRSLMEQTLKDIEYIFVNDCTPDHSMEILQRVLTDYPERQKNIRIIHHSKNAGSATVRNTGLRMVQGEYIIYCDSDDWVELDMYEAMYAKAKETGADIVGTDYYYEYADHTSIQKQNYPGNPLFCVRKMLAGELHCGTCNKLIRKAIYIKNNIFFPDGVDMWEDVLTTIPLCFRASKIVYLPKAYYHYVQFNANSYTKRMSEKSLRNMIEAIRRLEIFLQDNSLEGLSHELCYMKLTVRLCLLLNSKGEQRKSWSNIYPEANSCILTYKAMSRYWRIALKLASWRILFVFNAMVYGSKWIKVCCAKIH